MPGSLMSTFGLAQCAECLNRFTPRVMSFQDLRREQTGESWKENSCESAIRYRNTSRGESVRSAHDRRDQARLEREPHKRGRGGSSICFGENKRKGHGSRRLPVPRIARRESVAAIFEGIVGC